MIIFAYIWIAMLIMTVLFIILAGVIEKNFSEEHPVKKWWRRHIIGVAPNDVDI